MAAKPEKTPPPKIMKTPGEDSSDDLDKSIVKRQRERALAVQKEKKAAKDLKKQEKLKILNGIIRQLVKQTVNAIDEVSQDGKTSIQVFIDTWYSPDDGSKYTIENLNSKHMATFVEKLNLLGYTVTDHTVSHGVKGGRYDITMDKVRKCDYPGNCGVGPVTKDDDMSSRWIYYYVSIPMSED